jgi:DNA-binding XRE family transcriptional regulator
MFLARFFSETSGTRRGSAASLPPPRRYIGAASRCDGAALRTARKQRGTNQEALCEGADLDQTYASLLERGLRTPTLAVILDIAQALGVEPTQLVSDTIARLPGEG